MRAFNRGQFGSPPQVVPELMISAFVPSAPAGLVGTSSTPGVVDLSWSPPAEDGGLPITKYRISYTHGIVGLQEAEQSNQVTAFQLGTQQNGQTVTYTVEAYNTVGKGLPATVAVLVS